MEAGKSAKWETFKSHIRIDQACTPVCVSKFLLLHQVLTGLELCSTLKTDFKSKMFMFSCLIMPSALRTGIKSNNVVLGTFYGIFLCLQVRDLRIFWSSGETCRNRPTSSATKEAFWCPQLPRALRSMFEPVGWHLTLPCNKFLSKVVSLPCSHVGPQRTGTGLISSPYWALEDNAALVSVHEAFLSSHQSGHFTTLL